MKYFGKKYKKIIIKLIGNIVRPRFGWKKKLIKFVKFFYLLIEIPFEILGDILFVFKRFKKVTIENPKKILIIKTDQFGDVLFSTFLLPIIKKNYPEIQIDYLINPKTEIILKNNPNIRKILFWSDPFLYFLIGRNEKRSSFLKLIQQCIECIKNIRSERYDIIINTRAYPPSNNIFLKLMGPKNIIAFDISEQSYLADVLANYDLKEEDWKNYLNLISPFCKNTQDETFNAEFYNFDDNIFKKIKVDGKYVVISPISFDPERYWPNESWKEIIKKLVEKKYKIVLTGLPFQEQMLREITVGIDNDKIILATKFSIAEIASIIKGSDFWLGIDSFPAHLSIALKKKTYCLLNGKYYFLKGYSTKTWIDAKAMIPLIKDVFVFNINSTSKDIEQKIEETIQ